MPTDTMLATGWFEDQYRRAEAGGVRPSWADLRPNPNLIDWLGETRPDPGPVIVVGCGLGDDAAALAEAGFTVTAFDVAPTAVAAARRRFADTPVTWRTADLFALPSEWVGGFPLVVEIFTVQALPLSLRSRALAAVASLVGAGGTLFLFCRGREEKDPLNAAPPWPLTRADLKAIDAAGLRSLAFEDFADPHEPARPRRFRATWRRL